MECLFYQIILKMYGFLFTFKFNPFPMRYNLFLCKNVLAFCNSLNNNVQIDSRSRDPSVVSLFVHEDLGVVVHDARTGFNP